MADLYSKKAGTFLGGQDLLAILRKAKLLNEINEQLAKYLPPEIMAYCQAANIIDNKLIILTANGSLATQIRLRTPTLLEQFKADPLLKNFKEIQPKVKRETSTRPSRQKPKEKLAPLTPETAQMVYDIAQSISDPKLREILERIAKRTK